MTPETSSIPQGRAARRRLAVPVAVVALAALVLVGCGVNPDPDPEPTPSSTDSSTTTGTARAGSTAPATDDRDGDDDRGDGTTTAPPVTAVGPITTVELDPAEVPYVDAVTAKGTDELGAAEAECLAGRWVQAIGVDALDAAGVTPAALEAGDKSFDDVPIDEATATVMVSGFESCGIDIVELFVDAYAGPIAEDPERAACVESKVTPEIVRSYYVQAMSGGAMDDAEALIEPCFE